MLSPGWANAVRALVLALAVTTVTSLVSRTLKATAGELAPIWLTNAALLAQMMVTPQRQRWWAFAGGVLGYLSASLLAGERLFVAVSYLCANLLEVLVGLAFAPPLSTVAELFRPKSLVKFMAGAVLLAPAASGLLVTAMLHGQPVGHALQNFRNWFLSDALNLAILTPAAVVFWTGEVTQLLRGERGRKTGCLLLLVCVITTAVSGQNHFLLLYWALPPIVLLAFQADLAGLMVGLLLCLGIAVSFTVRGSGPLSTFPYGGMQSRIFELQLFLVAALGIAVPISATQARRSRLLAVLRDLEQRYRILAENATDVVMSMALDGRLTYVSPRAMAVTGIAPENLVGLHLPDLVLSDDRDALAAAIESMAMGATEASRVIRFQRTDGRVVWMEMYLRPVIEGIRGKPQALTATAHDITERRAAEQRLAEERNQLHAFAFRDGLTGVFNRRYFDRELALQSQQDARKKDRGFVAVVMVDVDGYKTYNDRYGHQAGDECLRAVAQAIASSAKRPADIVARYGGDEFALILKDTDPDGARVVSERIRQVIESLEIGHVASRAGTVTVSCGVAAQRLDRGADSLNLVMAADRALYAAKRRGRNQTCVAGADDADDP
ncbi:bifunctional diguanylate cyclase/phosphodiesterase [Paraburkholderia kirstenboschensis]|uniref:diguanylate cyclase n=1 Tax=Paraburkholderia kirstenboschensis TaxID=1245436 RepID=A0ABZ0ECD7_9BURK|nr:diguanylate cyclase [Paraburkholderia kirstenboschensis]WOD14165.1 diguanylate cyclase [Paraburkholderia kirstenboschensis]